MATKTYPHAVIWNGEYVPANTPIEVEEAAVVAETTEAEAATETTEAEAKKPNKRGVKGNDK